MKRKALILFALASLIITPTLFGKSSILVFVIDMYDQRSIKPQEVGSVTKFPIHSVSTDGRYYEAPGPNFDWMGKEFGPEATKNPVPASPESLANGQLKYDTYCAVCHTDSAQVSEMGTARSKVNDKGMVAPAVVLLTPNFTDGYIYNKAKWGGAVMPPLGYATTEKDRWDIVNYIRQKLEKQQ